MCTPGTRSAFLIAATPHAMGQVLVLPLCYRQGNRGTEVQALPEVGEQHQAQSFIS